MSEHSKSTPGSSGKKCRVHKRTYAVVFCLVLLPWLLIAIPGTTSAGGGTTGSNVHHSLHGWPFVHLESTHYDVTGNWGNGKFFLGQMPPGLDLAKQAKEAAGRYTENKGPVQLNLRFQRDSDFKAQWLGEVSYWSELSNWPVWKAGMHLTPRYLGLVLNLLCVILLAVLVTLSCERRIRRHGRLLKYSLASLFLGTALFAAIFSWIVCVQQETVVRARWDNSLQAIYDQESELIGFHREFEARFPLIISQLFNHGMHPWGTVPFFKMVKSGNIDIDLENESQPDAIERIAKLATASQYAVNLGVMDFCPDRQFMLHSLNGAKVVTLDLDFDAHDWMHLEFGDDRKLWEEALEINGFRVDLGIDMSRLESVRLDLDWTIAQAEQLRPFTGLPSLKAASISGLSQEGAEFILEFSTRWPDAMEFEFNDDVSEEMQQELKIRFDAGRVDDLINF